MRTFSEWWRDLRRGYTDAMLASGYQTSGTGLGHRPPWPMPGAICPPCPHPKACANDEACLVRENLPHEDAMKVEVWTHVKETIEVDLPYYYEHDCSGDGYLSVRYGKIEMNKVTSVHLSISGPERSYEVAVNTHSGCGDGSYFKPEYRSTQAEFASRLKEALDFVSKASAVAPEG